MPWMICLQRCIFRARNVVANNQFAVRKEKTLHPYEKMVHLFYCAPFYEHNIADRLVLQGRVDLNHLPQLDDRLKLLKKHTKRKYHKRWSYTWFYYAILLCTIFNMETRYIFDASDKNWVAKKPSGPKCRTQNDNSPRSEWLTDERGRNWSGVRRTEIVEIASSTKEKMLKWKWS